MRGGPPDERRWTEIAGGILAVVFIGAALIVALLPVYVHTGDGSECGSVLFPTGSARGCEGATTPQLVASLVLLALGVAAIMRVAAMHSRPR